MLVFGSLCDRLNVRSWFNGRKCVGMRQNASKPWLKTWGRPWHVGMRGYAWDAGVGGASVSTASVAGNSKANEYRDGVLVRACTMHGPWEV